MPSPKQKSAKASKAKKRAKGRATRRANAHSERHITDFLLPNDKRTNPRLYLAKIERVEGGRMDVSDIEGAQKTVRIAGAMALPSGLRHNPEVTAMRVGSFVLVDGGDAVAMLNSHAASNAKERAGWKDHSANSLFSRSRSRSSSK